MMTHHFVMTSSLLIQIFKIDKFGDFSCEIDFNIRTDVFRDVISPIINQSVRQPRKGSNRSALVYISIYIQININRV